MHGFAGDSELSPYLDRALDLSGEARALWLEELRAQDPAIADDIQQLLSEKQDIDREQFLEGATGLPPNSASLAGQAVGAYALESLLGQGGMGSLWLARRSDGRFEGKVAVKLLNLALLDRGGGRALQAQGSIPARLTHPHIARCSDAGVATAQPGLVLRCRRKAVDRYCDEMAPAEARRPFSRRAVAIGHAHSN
jgi:hypothetical protein